MYSVGHSKSLAAHAGIPIGCGWADGAEGISGRSFHSGARAFSALLYCVQLGCNLLHREPKCIVHDREPCNCRAAVRRIGVVGDELRRDSALGVPSRAQVRQGLNHYRTSRASVSGGIANRVGRKAVGAREIKVVPGHPWFLGCQVMANGSHRLFSAFFSAGGLLSACFGCSGT
jgi:hypothetical protein